MNPELILISGGARSGKSSLAVDIARRSEARVAYLATCVPADDEMRDRIRRHRSERPAEWITIEEPLNLLDILPQPCDIDILLIDCVTLWVSNMMLAGWDEQRILREVAALAESLAQTPWTSILVTNEVGSGIVPENALARAFRDTAGRVNALLAARAGEVHVCFCGIPMKIKG